MRSRWSSRSPWQKKNVFSRTCSMTYRAIEVEFEIALAEKLGNDGVRPLNVYSPVLADVAHICSKVHVVM